MHIKDISWFPTISVKIIVSSILGVNNVEKDRMPFLERENMALFY
jgi:hypothetical protein